MDTIGDILRLKGRTVWSIAPGAKVYDALVMMAEKCVGSLVVLDESTVRGLFSERDYLLKVDLYGRASQETLVGDVMSKEVFCVTPATSVEEAMAVVTESRSRHLVVMENEQLIGLVSIGDLVKALLQEKDLVIKQLTKYIKGEL